MYLEDQVVELAVVRDQGGIEHPHATQPAFDLIFGAGEPFRRSVIDLCSNTYDLESRVCYVVLGRHLGQGVVSVVVGLEVEGNDVHSFSPSLFSLADVFLTARQSLADPAVVTIPIPSGAFHW